MTISPSQHSEFSFLVSVIVCVISRSIWTPTLSRLRCALLELWSSGQFFYTIQLRFLYMWVSLPLHGLVSITCSNLISFLVRSCLHHLPQPKLHVWVSLYACWPWDHTKHKWATNTLFLLHCISVTLAPTCRKYPKAMIFVTCVQGRLSPPWALTISYRIFNIKSTSV